MALALTTDDIQAIARLGQPFGNTYFVRPSGGSDSNDGREWGTAWATVNKAAQTAVAGDRVLLAAGTFASGPTRIIPATGVHWRGCGIDVTKVTWSGQVLAARTHWVAKSNTVIEDLSMQVTDPSNAATFGGNTTDDPVVDNLLCRRVRFVSDLDCVTFANLAYFRNVRFEDCFLYSTFDGLQLAGNTSAKGGELMFLRSEVVCVSTAANRHAKCIISEPGNGGAVYKCTFVDTVFRSDTTGGSEQARAISLNGSQLVFTFIRCSIESYGNAPRDFHLQNSPTVRFDNTTVFVPSKVMGGIGLFAPLSPAPLEIPPHH